MKPSSERPEISRSGHSRREEPMTWDETTVGVHMGEFDSGKILVVVEIPPGVFLRLTPDEADALAGNISTIAAEARAKIARSPV